MPCRVGNGSHRWLAPYRRYRASRLAAYKIPRSIEFLSTLPKSSVLKVLRRELRDRELAALRGLRRSKLLAGAIAPRRRRYQDGLRHASVADAGIFLRSADNHDSTEASKLWHQTHQEKTMKRAFSFVASTCLGAALMYFGDPGQGTRRRATGRDRIRHIVREAGEMMGGVARHVANRARGSVAAAHVRIADGNGVPDDILIARIRARIGHVTSHPHGIEVKASGGRVTLAGDVPANEMTSLLKTVSAVPGVVEVEHSLTVHQSPNDILALRPRAPKHHRGAMFAAAVFGGAGAGALLALAPRRRGR